MRYMATDTWQCSSFVLYRFQIAAHQAEREVVEGTTVANRGKSEEEMCQTSLANGQ
jgi:hypothetical protein